MPTLLVLSCLPLLGGCVAGMAASAVGMAVQEARSDPASNAHLRPEAVAACTERAGELGPVHIIDVQQRSVDKLTVWGTAGEGSERRSFECGFTTRITGFKLRRIKS